MNKKCADTEEKVPEDLLSCDNTFLFALLFCGNPQVTSILTGEYVGHCLPLGQLERYSTHRCTIIPCTVSLICPHSEEIKMNEN